MGKVDTALSSLLLRSRCQGITPPAKCSKISGHGITTISNLILMLEGLTKAGNRYIL